jgi:carbonic anhydrase/acetyltransferase-like protein (isoleucine patch superfamily)
MLLDLNAYTEINVYELMRFHSESGCRVTNVADDRGLLGVTVLASSVLDQDSNISRRLSALSSCSSTFEFSGFVHRLTSASDYRQLVQYVLAGKCKARPAAAEVQPGVWIGEGARVHSTVRVLGPCFLGAKTRVKAGGVMAPGTAVERECEIDCGTVIEGACILPRTYVAPGLRISNAVVQGSRFIHLGRKLEVELGASGLLGSTENRASRRLLDTLGSVFAFGGSGLDLPTPSRAPASLDYVRGNGFME